ncbi:FAD-binding protein [Microbacterium sp. zg.Y1090]|uniref:D-arabinono-1,4-lactone oxidase n=1 Tax=Microbacterium TaxID=33882 RepID=UPI00214C5506|nr:MULTISPECIES: D-arabinono-1,4-lactone oxidase [unclassified Microbacterium]MCR2812174.1 FAD-binding protein [Microbacterium sp. zg.Y1084]MCR2818388.1 FAD-binding protein [Microbacterium sp. zg.Y1090]MDL5486201.1 D-arabinono-1,4-lactone oxidase [Microbacterium sp. zg-Y1211]WIM29402.1 D-arabinono-1,4-lactone oxidase [Microbacterium sp. zg-Y1090]
MTRPGGTWQNWGRSARVRPQRVERPATVAAVRRAVQSAARRGLQVKAVGSGHSFSPIAVAPGVLLDLGALTGLVSVDGDRARATLRAGTPLHRIPRLLASAGLAMANLGDIDRQTIAGAISTGTHGTGARFGGLATQVVGATLVTADGELLTVDQTHEPELLPAVALGLGALGILVEVTLQCVPTFLLHAVERPEPLELVAADLPGRLEAADHVEFYWFPGTDRALTKTNVRLPGSAPRRPLPGLGRWVDESLLANGLYRATCAAGAAVPALVPPVNRLATRLTGDREYTDVAPDVFTQRRTVRFREMEYAVPVDRLGAAFADVRALVADRRWRISFPVEVRIAAGDDLWLSTASGRPTGYIAVHRYWREDPAEYFEAAEEIMLRHDGRPHWGKMHGLDAARLRERYPHFDDFIALRDRLDPARMLSNPYLDRVLGG